MEQHLEDLSRAQKGKHSIASRRAMELNDLRPSQDAQGLKAMGSPSAMVSGGEAGLRRVVGGRKLKGGAYSDSQFGVINEPYSTQTGAGYGKMLGEHLMKTKGGAFVKEFVGGMSESCKAQRAKMPYSKVVLPCEAEGMSAGPTLKERLDAMKNPKPMRVGLKGGAKCPQCGYKRCRCMMGGAPAGGAMPAGAGTKKGMVRKTARRAFEPMSGGAPAGAGATGGKRTLPPALRKRADAMKRLIREEGMTFKEAIAYLKQHPPQ
jgi:hypothetical protein